MRMFGTRVEKQHQKSHVPFSRVGDPNRKISQNLASVFWDSFRYA
jgi:hypothetical protein